MKEKLFDIYGIIGLLLSVIAVVFSIYNPKEIPGEYILAVILGVSILIITFTLFNKFSEIDRKLKEIRKEVNNDKNKFALLNQRFKTIEALENIKVDIKELKRKVFKR